MPAILHERNTRRVEISALNTDYGILCRISQECNILIGIGDEASGESGD